MLSKEEAWIGPFDNLVPISLFLKMISIQSSVLFNEFRLSTILVSVPSSAAFPPLLNAFIWIDCWQIFHWSKCVILKKKKTSISVFSQTHPVPFDSRHFHACYSVYPLPSIHPLNTVWQLMNWLNKQSYSSTFFFSFSCSPFFFQYPQQLWNLRLVYQRLWKKKNAE